MSGSKHYQYPTSSSHTNSDPVMLFSRTDTTQSFVCFHTFSPSDSVGLISGSSVLNSPMLVDIAQDPNLTIPTCAIISFCSNYIYLTDIEAISSRGPTEVDNGLIFKQRRTCN